MVFAETRVLIATCSREKRNKTKGSQHNGTVLLETFVAFGQCAVHKAFVDLVRRPQVIQEQRNGENGKKNL